jgi:hypothetical protein
MVAVVGLLNSVPAVFTAFAGFVTYLLLNADNTRFRAPRYLIEAGSWAHGDADPAVLAKAAAGGMLPAPRGDNMRGCEYITLKLRWAVAVNGGKHCKSVKLVLLTYMGYVTGSIHLLQTQIA